MSEEKLLVITNTKRFWISQSMEEWNHQLHDTYNEIRIKQINGDKEEELIRFTFFHGINIKIPKFISTPTDKISNYHQMDFEILLIFPKFTELRFSQRRKGCTGTVKIYNGVRMHCGESIKGTEYLLPPIVPRRSKEIRYGCGIFLLLLLIMMSVNFPIFIVKYIYYRICRYLTLMTS